MSEKRRKILAIVGAVVLVKKYVITHKVVKGDSLILRRVLSAEIPEDPVLRFKTYHAFVEAFRDGNRIYSNGESNYYKNKIVGCGVHFVYLGAMAQIYDGRTLELKFHFSEKDAWNELPSFEVVPADFAFVDFFARYSVSLMVGLFLVLFGVFQCTFALGGPIQDWLQECINALYLLIVESLPESWFTSWF